MSANSETITLNDPKQDVEKNVNDAASQAPALAKESESPADAHLVQLEPADDPKCLSLWHKWLAVLAISSSSLCATFASSAVRPLSSSSPLTRVTPWRGTERACGSELKGVPCCEHLLTRAGQLSV